jgi:hypothetical protein
MPLLLNQSFRSSKSGSSFHPALEIRSVVRFVQMRDLMDDHVFRLT